MLANWQGIPIPSPDGSITGSNVSCVDSSSSTPIDALAVKIAWKEGAQDKEHCVRTRKDLRSSWHVRPIAGFYRYPEEVLK